MVVATTDYLKPIKDGAKTSIGEMRTKVRAELDRLKGALDGVQTRSKDTFVSRSEADEALKSARKRVMRGNLSVTATENSSKLMNALLENVVSTLDSNRDNHLLFEMLRNVGIDLGPLMDALTANFELLRDAPKAVLRLNEEARSDVSEAKGEASALTTNITALNGYIERLQRKLAELGTAEKRFEGVGAAIDDVLRRVGELEKLDGDTYSLLTSSVPTLNTQVGGLVMPSLEIPEMEGTATVSRAAALPPPVPAEGEVDSNSMNSDGIGSDTLFGVPRGAPPPALEPATYNPDEVVDGGERGMLPRRDLRGTSEVEAENAGSGMLPIVARLGEMSTDQIADSLESVEDVNYAIMSTDQIADSLESVENVNYAIKRVQEIERRWSNSQLPTNHTVEKLMVQYEGVEDAEYRRVIKDALTRTAIRKRPGELDLWIDMFFARFETTTRVVEPVQALEGVEGVSRGPRGYGEGGRG